ncbi:MAG: alpha-amylase/4-alpha-glucanotransferase domain-containing protein [Planctomycetaceae bacterium]
MTSPLRLILAIHNHQPVGNFDGVFEAAYQDSYAPFLNVLEDFPEIPISLHLSGSLLEWLVNAHPEYIDFLRRLIDRGQIEIIGGPFYEPILACIPRRDRVGQIRLYRSYLENLFGTTVRGMWMPERVWEQGFTSDIAEAGIEYTLLDDYHFKCSGLKEDQLHGYYLSEDEGRLLKIFPGSEKLRYTIPFASPQESIDYLRNIADRHPHAVVTFGDDGEKFGTWPGTKEHVYKNGWLRSFLGALRQNRDWIKVATLAEAVDQVPPLGRWYLSDCSYREMTEWALPTEQQSLYAHLVHAKEHEPDWPQFKQFLKGGFWRNFRVKYPESNEMYTRMLQVSRRLQDLDEPSRNTNSRDLWLQAQTELYRGQCNCPYWHGAFGGLYLPHLRNAIYKHLIEADSLLEKLSGRTDRWVEVTADDYNLDGRKEIRIGSNRMIAYLSPNRGGHLYELDLRQPAINLLATLNRRPEPYHEKVRNAGNQQSGQNDKVTSIHDLVRFKQPNLDKLIDYDHWPRKSLVDHFLQPRLSVEAFRKGEGELGDFVTGVYETVLRRSDDRVEVRMSRTGLVGPYQIRLTKTVALDIAAGGQIEIHYQLEDLPPEIPLHFAVELNFAAMAAGANDRYFYDADGKQLGQLQSVLQLESVNRIGLTDEWLGVDASVEFSQQANLWTLPIQSISQSEGGFELVHQSAAVIPHWEFFSPENGQWNMIMLLSIDTSVAQARLLREPVASSVR